MANSNPTQTKEKKTVRVALNGTPDYRVNSSTSILQDQRYVNTYIETIKNPENQQTKTYVNKRPGLTFNAALGPGGGPSSFGRGAYTWEFDNGNMYSVWGNKIYKIGSPLVVTMATNNGVVDWAESSTGNLLMVADGINLYLINAGGGVTTISSGTPNFPTPNLGNVVVFDGYTCVAKQDGTIWNSSVNDPTTWGALDFLVAESFSDLLVAIARQNDVLVAFGVYSTEMFYDAGTASPGSFMAPVQQATLQVGCASKNTIAQQENVIIWVARAETGGFTVQKLDGISTMKRVSTEAIEKVLNQEANAIVNATAFVSRQAGHFFYILNLYTQNRTLVYDVEQDHWTEWQSGSSGVYSYICSAQNSGTEFLQGISDSSMYSVDQTVYLDNVTPIEVTIRTSPWDFSSMYRKFCSRFELVCDRYTTTNLVTVTYTNDDYQTYSTARTVDLQGRAVLFAMGQFRRRAWNLFHNANMPLRMEAIELDVQVGSQ